MVFRTVFNIYPGDEIFVNYGENYWDDKRNSKVRQLSVESMSRHLDEIKLELDVVKEDNLKLVDQVESIKEALKEFFGVEPAEWLENMKTGEL